MKIENETTSRSYIISQKELKKKFGILGDIQSINLWAGLSPNEEEEGESHDKDELEIVTHDEVRNTKQRSNANE